VLAFIYKWKEPTLVTSLMFRSTVRLSLFLQQLDLTDLIPRPKFAARHKPSVFVPLQPDNSITNRLQIMRFIIAFAITFAAAMAAPIADPAPAPEANANLVINPEACCL
jgi:hypothetical protein